MAKAITARELDEVVMVDQVSKHKGLFKFRQGYYYRHGNDEQKVANRIIAHVTQAGFNIVIKEMGDHWAAFRGGASLAQSSHFWVTAEVTRK